MVNLITACRFEWRARHELATQTCTKSSGLDTLEKLVVRILEKSYGEVELLDSATRQLLINEAEKNPLSDSTMKLIKLALAIQDLIKRQNDLG